MKKETKNRTIQIRLSEADFAIIAALAAQDESSKTARGEANISAFCRNALLSAANIREKSLEEQLARMSYEMRKIGVNINQAVKFLNSGYGSRTDVEAIISSQQKLERLFEDFKDGLEGGGQPRAQWARQACEKGRS